MITGIGTPSSQSRIPRPISTLPLLKDGAETAWKSFCSWPLPGKPRTGPATWPVVGRDPRVEGFAPFAPARRRPDHRREQVGQPEGRRDRGHAIGPEARRHAGRCLRQCRHHGGIAANEADQRRFKVAIHVSSRSQAATIVPVAPAKEKRT